MIDKALEDKGFRIMCFLYLSPMILFNTLNYVAGIAPINLAQHAYAMIAILLGTVSHVFLGAMAGSLANSSQSDDNSTIEIVSIVVSVVFRILGVAAVSCYAKKELNNVIQRQKRNK